MHSKKQAFMLILVNIFSDNENNNRTVGALLLY